MQCVGFSPLYTLLYFPNQEVGLGKVRIAKSGSLRLNTILWLANILANIREEKNATDIHWKRMPPTDEVLIAEQKHLPGGITLFQWHLLQRHLLQ